MKFAEVGVTGLEEKTCDGMTVVVIVVAGVVWLSWITMETLAVLISVYTICMMGKP